MDKSEIGCYKITQWTVKMAGVDRKYDHNCNCVLWCRNSMNYMSPYSRTDQQTFYFSRRMFVRNAF